MKLRPKVVVLRNEEGQAMPEEIVDLAKMATDKKGNVYTIKNVVDPQHHHINPKQYYSPKFIDKGFSFRKMAKS
jgi:hypothetical protein